VYSNGFIIDGYARRLKTFFDIEKPKRGYVFQDLLRANFIPILSVIVKKSVIDETGLFDTKFSTAEDWDLLLRASRICSVDYIDEPLVEYRIHNDSFSRRRILMLKEVNQIADRYSKDLATKKMISNHRFSLALAYLGLSDNVNARMVFRESMKRDGVSFKSFIGMMLSYLPDSILHRLPVIAGTGTGLHESVLKSPSNSKTRVLYVIDTSDIGGTGIQVIRLMQHIDPERFDIYIICPPEGELVKQYKKYAKRVYELSGRKFFSLSAIRQVASIIERENIDIVHSKLFTSDFCAAIAARSKKRIFVSTIVGFNFLYMRGDAFEKTKKWLESYFYRIIYLFADKVIAVSQAVKDDLVGRAGVRIDPKKIEVIYCGVPDVPYPKSLEVRNEYHINADDRVVSCAGSLFYGKGQMFLLRSAPCVLKKFPKVKFFLVGDGPERSTLEKEAQILGIRGNVVFTGNLPEEKKNEVLYLSEIVVLPSISEGCPQVILEAMSMAKPVVATDVGGIPELVEDGRNGILVGPKDPAALSRALLTLLSDVEIRKSMGEAGRSSYEADFSVEKMARLTFHTYTTLMNGTRSQLI